MKQLLNLVLVVLLVIAGGLVYGILSLQSDGNSGGNFNNNAVGTVEMISAPDGAVTPPELSTTQLRTLLPESAELPPDFQAATREVVLTSLENAVKEVAWANADTWVATIFEPYFKNIGVEATYTACSQSVGEITVNIGQTPTVDAARQFVDDPAVLSYYVMGMTEPTPFDNLHGWIATPDVEIGEDDCYAETKVTISMFEYWGLRYIVNITRDAQAGPELSRSIISALIPVLIQRANTLLGDDPLPPTPVPSGETQLLTAATQLDELGGFMPAITDLGIPANIYTVNQDFSTTYTAVEYIEMYRGLNANLAAEIERAARNYGMVGQAVRLWDTGDRCPDILGISLEMDIMLFERPAGPVAYMNDTGIQQAWRNTGLLTEFTPQFNGVLMKGQIPGHHCGSIRVVGMMLPFERLLITFVLNSYQFVDEAEVVDIVVNAMPFTMLDLFVGHLH